MPFDQFLAERNTGDNDTVHVHDMKGNDSFAALKKDHLLLSICPLTMKQMIMKKTRSASQ